MSDLYRLSELLSQLDNAGNMIRELRLARGVTQKELAAILGITPVHLCNIEAGKNVVTRDLLSRVVNWAAEVSGNK